MARHPSTTVAHPQRHVMTPSVVSLNMAHAMIGRTVEVLTGTKRIEHGVVSGVFEEAGKPRIVVGRHSYDMNQILAVTPAS